MTAGTSYTSMLNVQTIDMLLERRHGVCGGSMCLAGTRIPVWLVVSFFKDGSPVEALGEMYQVPPRTIESAIRYAFQYPKEIQREIKRNRRA